LGAHRTALFRLDHPLHEVFPVSMGKVVAVTILVAAVTYIIAKWLVMVVETVPH